MKLNRITKTIGSITLAAALVFGTVGVVPAQTDIAKAATTPIDATSLAAMLEQVKTATLGVIATQKTKEITSITIDNPLNPDAEPMSASAVGLTDPVGKIMSFSITNGEKKSNAYADLGKKLVYMYNDELKRYEVRESAGFSTESMTKAFDPAIFTSLGDAVSAVLGEAKQIGSTMCKNIELNIKADQAKIKELAPQFSALFGSAGSLFGGSINVSGFDLSTANIDISQLITGIDFKLNTYIDDLNVLKGADIDGTINVNVGSLFGNLGTTDIPPIAAKIVSSSTCEVTDETAEIPADVVKKAELAAGVNATASGLEFVSTVRDNKNTVFTLTAVKNKKAKKITIPATIKKLGKSYKVLYADSFVFKKCKNLKTLVVKNKSLRKLLKDGRSNYGIKKKVKIK
ncbi:MAG: hypothetical protein J6P16_04980 [Eubacterium sp.]|nr:hypothetical protein [Eubacterium sp.]